MNVADQLVPAVVMTEAFTLSAGVVFIVARAVRRIVRRRRVRPLEIDANFADDDRPLRFRPPWEQPTRPGVEL